jgi:hypothetical protein
MNRGDSPVFIVGAFFVSVLILSTVVVASLAGTRTETSVSPETLNAEDLESDTALIIGKSQSGGHSILGVHFGKTTYRAHVGLTTGPGCFDLVDDGSPWPAPFEECSSPVAITGEISGGGVAATGESIIGVAVEVNASCYADVIGGEPWPPEETDCVAAD